MLRILLGAHGTILRSIVSKYITKMLKKNGLNAVINTNDFVVYEEGEMLTIHMSGDIKVKQRDLLDFLNNKMDVAE